MPRFSFPVPGRRHRHPPESVISPPLNKVQKFLGTAEINVDSGRSWDARSSSCISISVSESSAADGRSVVESGVLPRRQAGPPISINLPDEQSTTDASSIRRRQSNSTITSYYDKSKVPLVISQQTSSSAMAKGLPQRASCLLEGDATNNYQKAKPAKLDLSLLLPRRKASSQSLNVPSTDRERGLVLGPDMVTQSPSYLSVLPQEYARPRSGSQGERKLKKRSILGGRRDPANQYLGSPTRQPGISEHETIGLQNLYEHYEQMTFRDAAQQIEDWDPEEKQATSRTPTRWETTASMPKTVETRESVESVQRRAQTTVEKPVGRPVERPAGRPADRPLQRPERADRPTERTERPIGRLPERQAKRQLDRPLPRSSDRPSEHDRSIERPRSTTEKPIKRPDPKPAEPTGRPNERPWKGTTEQTETNSSNSVPRAQPSRLRSNSLLQVDLLQTSVLSLSDSEDDCFVVQTKPKEVVQLTQTRVATQTSERRRTATSREPTLAKKASRDSLSTSKGMARPKTSTSASSQPRAVYQPSPPSAIANYATRPMPTPPRGSSRISRTSAASSHASSSVVQSSYGIHEARVITMIPAQYGGISEASTSTDQLTPPLSPMSMEFYLRTSRPSGPDFDEHSVLSDDTTQHQVMMVTRQEELLLAALRKKRTRMRESMTTTATAESETSQQRARQSIASSRYLALPYEEGSTVGSQYSQHSLHSQHTFDEHSSMTELDDGWSVSLDSYDDSNQSPLGPGHHQGQAAFRPATTTSSSHGGSRSRSRGRRHTKAGRRALDDDNIDVQIFDERSDMSLDSGSLVDDLPGVPRPDSPIEAQSPLPRKKGVRLSAVGPAIQSEWW